MKQSRERHPHTGDWLREIVFGMNDGLVTTLVFLMAVSGVASTHLLLVWPPGEQMTLRKQRGKEKLKVIPQPMRGQRAMPKLDRTYLLCGYQARSLTLGLDRREASRRTDWLGLDSSGMERLEATTSRDRGMIYVPNMPHATRTVSVGWQFSTVMLLPEQPSSWAGLLEQRRIGTEQTAIEVGIAQLRVLLPLINRPVTVLADRWYALAAFVRACHELGCQALIRLKRNRKLYRAAPPRQEKQRGAPRKHAPLFQGTDPETYGPGDAQWEGTDEHGKRVVVSCWNHLHFREAPQAEVSVIRVQREAARETKRDLRESWFIWIGTQDVPLAQVCSSYRKRFSQEHGYRFLKQDLLWEHAHLSTPEQVERWSWIVACACNQLLLFQESGLAVASVGKPTASSDPSAGSPSDAWYFAAAWHTGSTAQTTRKIARLEPRQSENARTTLSCRAQTQTSAKSASQTHLSVSKSLSYVIHSNSSHRSRPGHFRLNVNLERMVPLAKRMDLSLLSGESELSDRAEAASLVYLLEQGLGYVQRGDYAEGVAVLKLAREQLASGQAHLAAVLDSFVQEYVKYRRVEYTLQEVSMCFAEACTELRNRVTEFEMVLPMLIRGMDAAYQQLQKGGREPSLELQPPGGSSIGVVSANGGAILPALSITCLGPFEVRRLGQAITLCTNRCGQRILRYLIAQPEHRATADVLQGMFWPEDELEMAQRKLHSAVSALRRSLNAGQNCEPGAGYILCKNRVYSLNPAVTIQTDIDEFLQYHRLGRQQSDERIAYYEKACQLYTRPFLLEDVYADWSSLQREQLSQTYLTMCRELTDHYLGMKCYEDAAKWATAILKENCCDEAAHRQLIQIHAAQGHRSKALQQYQRCERILHEELSVKPLPETTRLVEALLSGKTFTVDEGKT